MPTAQLDLRLCRQFYGKCQSPSISLQFLISEFFQTYDSFRKIVYLINEEQYGEPLNSLISSLISFQFGQFSLFSKKLDESNLSKLLHYATCLERHEIQALHDTPSLSSVCRQCWMLGLQILESIDTTDFKRIFPLLKKIRHVIKRIGNDLVKAIILLKDDENILYFVLRHTKQFDELYGIRFTSKLFKSLFGQSLGEARNYLVTKYSNRGFHELVPKIDSYFTEIS